MFYAPLPTVNPVFSTGLRHFPTPDDVTPSLNRAAVLDAEFGPALMPARHPWISTGLPAELDDDELDAAAADLAMADVATELEPLPACTCCGREGEFVPLVGTDLSMCDDCLATNTFNPDGADVVRAYFAAETVGPLTCECGAGCGSVEQLARHLRRFHKLDDKLVASGIVGSVEYRDRAAAAA